MVNFSEPIPASLVSDALDVTPQGVADGVPASLALPDSDSPTVEMHSEVEDVLEATSPNPVIAPENPSEGGEPGVISLSNLEFINTIFGDLPADTRAAVCSKIGDLTKGRWDAQSADQYASSLPADHNNYFNCSSFRPNNDGSLNATNENFVDCRVIVLDDVGTKIPEERLADFEFSYKIETSPDNYHVGILLDNPITDRNLASKLWKALIKKCLCDKDAVGPVRWVRLPNGINGKPHHGASGQPFKVRLVKWNPDKRYTVEEIIAAFNLEDVLSDAGGFEEIIARVKNDSAAVLEPENVDALAKLKQIDPVEYQRKRSELKQINAKVSLTNIDRAVKMRLAEIDIAPTHHGYSKSLINALTVGAWTPVGYQGSLYVLNEATNLWVAKPTSELIRAIANEHDGKDNCKKASDYRAIAQHAITLVDDDKFFKDAANGVACNSGFYQVTKDGIELVPLTPEHRQWVMLDFTPEEMPTPMFDQFLQETFRSVDEDETAQQLLLVQEIVGAIMLGIAHKFQKAFLFYEPFGRAGKGTLERQIRSLVPADFISAISPFKWHQDYHVATLAGKRLNVVGELPENEAIPSAAFKSVIGSDLITGRHPTHRPISFINEAAHLFMSNHLITTKDQSEAFFARWLIVEFPNSRLKLGLPLDKDLPQRIIDHELPGIAFWALQGAERLLKNGAYTSSAVHDRLLAKWRRSTNTLEEFIHETCEIFVDGRYRRSELYKDYTDWCIENGRKPFSKGRVKELLEHNIGMGIRLVEINGHETFRGLMPKVRSPYSVG